LFQETTGACQEVWNGGVNNEIYYMHQFGYHNPAMEPITPDSPPTYPPPDKETSFTNFGFLSENDNRFTSSKDMLTTNKCLTLPPKPFRCERSVSNSSLCSSSILTQSELRVSSDNSIPGDDENTTPIPNSAPSWRTMGHVQLRDKVIIV